MANFPKSKGALFLNAQKAGENHPDLRGHLHITPEQIQMLIQMGQGGVEVKLQVAGWQRVSQAGAAYIFLEGEAYMKIADQSQPAGGFQQPQNQAPQMMPQQPQQQPPVQQQPYPQNVPQQGFQQQPAPPAPMQPQPPMQQGAPAPQQAGYAQQPAPQQGENDFTDDDIPF